MTHRTRTQVFRLLLILTMVIQPIAIAHAMTTVECAQDQAMADMSGQAGHQMTQQVSSAGQYDSHHGDHAMKDCCNTSTCCSAAIVDTVSTAFMSIHADSTHSSISWRSVIIPSEIKPPRHLHG